MAPSGSLLRWPSNETTVLTVGFAGVKVKLAVGGWFAERAALGTDMECGAVGIPRAEGCGIATRNEATKISNVNNATGSIRATLLVDDRKIL